MLTHEPRRRRSGSPPGQPSHPPDASGPGGGERESAQLDSGGETRCVAGDGTGDREGPGGTQRGDGRRGGADQKGATPAKVIVSLPPILLTQQEAAEVLRVSVSYLRERAVPQVHLPGRPRRDGRESRPLVRYRLADLQAWADAYRS